MGSTGGLPTLHTLTELARLVEDRDQLYVRWSRGPETDLTAVSSTDDLTGISLPGLSANPLDVAPWWQDRSVRVWVARRLYDYSHLPREKGPGVRAWVLRGTEADRGPDNEPLVTDVEPLGWIDPRVLEEAEEEVKRHKEQWGPLRREG
ncbi:hypothetical protein C3486_28565 [Streptomyces sp. Ru73]|uniref:DUF6098 family protein n=1 Tax=Streptomyces sp. Ru73 TaxID=2080748 RepID=UPI000CDD75A8|nr:DUF6098 family protein [Streptomyces sp. Ru73]POX37418.1 hypothetical protein C3486_28565 [Streptomyces sp. Ru73]